MTDRAQPSARLAARIVLVCSLSLFIIFGIRLSFSVFFAEFVLVEGWSSEAAAAIFSLNMLAFALTAPLAGYALDRYGPRPVFGFGVILMALGLWLSGQAQSLEDLLLAYGIIEGCGLGITGLGPIASVVAGWTPPARRGRALGIAFAGTGLGSLVFVPLANLLITQFGWRDAYAALSLLCLCLLLPLMVFGLKKPPPVPNPRRTGQRLRQRVAWRVLLRQPVFLGADARRADSFGASAQLDRASNCLFAVGRHRADGGGECSRLSRLIDLRQLHCFGLGL